jgi:hypothetical protein
MFVETTRKTIQAPLGATQTKLIDLVPLLWSSRFRLNLFLQTFRSSGANRKFRKSGAFPLGEVDFYRGKRFVYRVKRGI